MVLIGLFGALSFGAWTQQGVLVTGLGDNTWEFSGVWQAVSIAVLLPMLALLGLWTGTLAGGRPRPSTPLVFALISGALLVGGIAAGIPAAYEQTDLFDTTWTTGQAYLVLGATLAAAVAGLIFWAPKLYGNLIPEGIGRMVAPLLFLGTATAAVSYGIAGILDEPTFIGDPSGLDDLDTIEVLNLVGAIGLAVVLLGGLLFILGLLRTRMAGTGAVGDDPWNGHTLEWATTSPPPIGNFASLPEITSEAPVYDARHAALAGES
jgi:heme/copper-type cytochrome/quinol oxidase subunit 1